MAQSTQSWDTITALPSWLSGLTQDAQPATESSDAAAIDEPVGSPFYVTLAYTLASDYVFRGINFSEYPGEGREKPNHQLEVNLDVDLALLLGEESGAWGTLSLGTWFEWFAAQKKLDPVKGGQNLQEVDYNLSWSFDVESMATTLTLGYNFYTIPNAKNFNTSEWWFTLEHNDAWMWEWMWPDNEDGVLNPFIYYAQDIEATPGAIWIDVGISHDFGLFENLTVTPSFTIATDHRYLDPVVGTGKAGSTRLAYVEYGLMVGYDLSTALGLPQSAGSLYLSGFLTFNEVVGNVKDERIIQDEFYGGVSLAWSF